MIHVRRHLRITASGKHATVRAHEREGDTGQREVPGWVQPPYVGDLTPAPIRARCSYPGCDDGRLSDGRDCPHCRGDGEVLMPVTEMAVTEDFWDDDDQAARDSVTYGEPVDKSDIGAWAEEMAARDQAAADAAALREQDAQRPVALCPVCARPLNGPERSCQCAATPRNIAAWGRVLRDAGY